MRRLVLAGLLAALALPAHAAGGGWWSYPQLDRSAAAPGQRVTVRAEVLFPSRAAAAAAERGGFFVYALRGLDRSIVERALRLEEPGDWWSPGRADARELGPVSVRVVDANLARARASFVVPALPVGRYAVMLCTAGCARPLADIVPVEGFEVVADRATSRLVERVRRLDERLVRQAGVLAEIRAALRESREAAKRSGAALARAEARLVAAERPAGRARASRVASAGWGVAAALLLAVLLLLRRGRRPAPPAWPGDAELAEILSAERPRDETVRR